VNLRQSYDELAEKVRKILRSFGNRAPAVPVVETTRAGAGGGPLGGADARDDTHHLSVSTNLEIRQQQER